MQAAANGAHSAGLQYSIYNTMRELSNHCRELHALCAINETYVVTNGKHEAEIFFPHGTQAYQTFLTRSFTCPPPPHHSSGQGSDWIQEHVHVPHGVAWSSPLGGFQMDAAIQVVGWSRWNNYYIRGLQQLQQEIKLDGIYLDEIAYDRVTMERARRQLGDDAPIDHHSDSGAFYYSPAIGYTELYPFLSRLWCEWGQSV